MDKKGKICVVMMDIREDYRDDYVVGIERQANKMGFSTFIFSMPLLNESSSRNEEAVFDLINFDHYDGVIFFAMSFSANKALGKKIEKMVYDNCKKPIVSLGDSVLFDNHIHGDNTLDYEILTDHIIEKHNCHVLYFLGGEQGHSSGRDDGFMTSLKKHNLVCTDDNMIYGGFWVECAEKLAKDIAYNYIEKPDAVMCYDDAVAFFFIKALAKYGIRVPEDIIVAGFDAKSQSKNHIIPITTYSSSSEYEGRCAVSTLISLITGENPIPISRPRGSIITGSSCGCGLHKPLDVRLGLELHEKRRMEEIYYHNSNLEERLYTCNDYNGIFDVINNTNYLIPDKNLFSVSIHKKNSKSTCIYMTDNVRAGNFSDFDTLDLYPRELLTTNEPKNTHILPISFGGEMFGHVTVGYNDPIVYNFLLKRYVSRLAIALNILSIKNNASIKNNTISKYEPETDDSSSVTSGNDAKQTPGVIFVLKDGSLNKVPLENVLCFEVEGRKTYAVLKTGRYEIKKTLTELEELLSSKKFMRISKSTLVNMEKVVRYVHDSDRTIIATLSGQIEVRVSRSKVHEFKDAVTSM